jgi:hypothetical protein
VNKNKILDIGYTNSHGDSITLVLSPKRDIIIPKTMLAKPLVSYEPLVRKVTKSNPDPKASLALSYLEKLLRKTRIIQGQASSFIGKPIPIESIPILEETLFLVPKEEVIEEKFSLE